jgi:hypothetical protein
VADKYIDRKIVKIKPLPFGAFLGLGDGALSKEIVREERDVDVVGIVRGQWVIDDTE